MTCGACSLAVMYRLVHVCIGAFQQMRLYLGWLLLVTCSAHLLCTHCTALCCDRLAERKPYFACGAHFVLWLIPHNLSIPMYGGLSDLISGAHSGSILLLCHRIYLLLSDSRAWLPAHLFIFRLQLRAAGCCALQLASYMICRWLFLGALLNFFGPCIVWPLALSF